MVGEIEQNARAFDARNATETAVRAPRLAIALYALVAAFGRHGARAAHAAAARRAARFALDWAACLCVLCTVYFLLSYR